MMEPKRIHLRHSLPQLSRADARPGSAAHGLDGVVVEHCGVRQPSRLHGDMLRSHSWRPSSLCLCSVVDGPVMQLVMAGSCNSKLLSQPWLSCPTPEDTSQDTEAITTTALVRDAVHLARIS